MFIIYTNVYNVSTFPVPQALHSNLCIYRMTRLNNALITVECIILDETSDFTVRQYRINIGLIISFVVLGILK